MDAQVTTGNISTTCEQVDNKQQVTSLQHVNRQTGDYWWHLSAKTTCQQYKNGYL